MSDTPARQLYDTPTSSQPHCDEPISARVRSEVEKQEGLRMVQEYRRASDRWNYWTGKVVMIVLGVLASSILGLITWLFDVRDTLNRQDIFISQNTSDILRVGGDIRELQITKAAVVNLEKIVSTQFDMLQGRLSDQDKRQQMQGEGLIAGNRSIHEALDKLMFVVTEVSDMDKRVTILEREQGRTETRRRR